MSIFIAVIAAFALNNWNDNKRDHTSEKKILIEISNGLQKDIEDVRHNILGHKYGISSCDYFKDLILGKELETASITNRYFNLTRDFISIQNVAGYETLKSRGLELVRNDSLRRQIISLYEYDYKSLLKLEEQYSEMQFQENYFLEINKILAPNFQFNTDGELIGVFTPMDISEDNKKLLLTYLWKIKRNREFILDYYSTLETKINLVQQMIKEEN